MSHNLLWTHKPVTFITTSNGDPDHFKHSAVYSRSFHDVIAVLVRAIVTIVWLIQLTLLISPTPIYVRDATVLPYPLCPSVKMKEFIQRPTKSRVNMPCITITLNVRTHHYAKRHPFWINHILLKQLMHEYILNLSWLVELCPVACREQCARGKLIRKLIWCIQLFILLDFKTVRFYLIL